MKVIFSPKRELSPLKRHNTGCFFLTPKKPTQHLNGNKHVEFKTWPGSAETLENKFWSVVLFGNEVWFVKDTYRSEKGLMSPVTILQRELRRELDLSQKHRLASHAKIGKVYCVAQDRYVQRTSSQFLEDFVMVNSYVPLRYWPPRYVPRFVGYVR